MSFEDFSCLVQPDNTTYCTEAGPGPGWTYPPELGDGYCRIADPKLDNCPDWYTFEGVCYADLSTGDRSLVPCPEPCQNTDAIFFACARNQSTVTLDYCVVFLEC